MKEYVFGANILENLTTGMYQDSKVIYREYIQNACDQIDKARSKNLLKADEGNINIWLDAQKRIITIEDDATGIPEKEFVRTLGNIADSDKKQGEDKGFRGIGRLCGLAYCKELIFTTTAYGEETVSILRCDASKMRKLLSENVHGEKHTATEVLNSIYSFAKTKTAKKEEHWFKVELVDINQENTALLDFEQIKEYLSFVAPVPYQNTFIFKTEVYKHAEMIGHTIDEYKISLDGEQIFKKYKTKFKTSKGEDEIFDIEFEDLYDEQKNLLGWAWIGVSKFKAVISSECKMRGIRLRKENIQIGTSDALQKLFSEDRGNHYFVGEVFALGKDLIPNSQRDYFNENTTKVEFEKCLKKYFRKLYRLYHDGSAINSAFAKIDNYNKKEAEFNDRQVNKDFVDKEHIEKSLLEVAKAKKDAEDAFLKLEKRKQRVKDENDKIVSKVIARIEKERNTSSSNVVEKTKVKDIAGRRVDKLSAYSKGERKLISKIFGIILKATDDKTAEMIIKKIEEELK